MKLAAVDWDEGRHRWADIASQPFAPAMQTAFSYADASVSLDFAPSGATFAGRIAAQGLKPNFAYQIKLNGKPDRDPWANEQLGLAGRWWATQTRKSDGSLVTAWRSNDDEFHRWKALGFTDGATDVVFEGYLLLDFLIADPAGTAARDLTLDSSFHVLWKTLQREPHAEDSEPLHHTVVARAATGWYPVDLPDAPIAIYAEWEPGRARPGECALPPGHYATQLVLTEESFHEREPDRGSWATVMSAPDVAFTIVSAL